MSRKWQGYSSRGGGGGGGGGSYGPGGYSRGGYGGSGYGAHGGGYDSYRYGDSSSYDAGYGGYGGGGSGGRAAYGYQPYEVPSRGGRGGGPGGRGAGSLSNWMYGHNADYTEYGGKVGAGARGGGGVGGGGYGAGAQGREDYGGYYGSQSTYTPLSQPSYGYRNFADPYSWDPNTGCPTGGEYEAGGEGDATEGDPYALDFEQWYEGDNEKYCPLCDATCTGEEPWKSHIQGARHRKKKSKYLGFELPEPQKAPQRPKKPPPNPEELDDIDKPKLVKDEKGNPSYRCELCKVNMQDMRVYSAHITGTKHTKKKQATALWGLGAEHNICSICRIDLDNACLKCENNKKPEECSVIGGECSHQVHDCCMQLWSHNDKCPVCGEAWKVAKKTQFLARPKAEEKQEAMMTS